MKHEIDKLIANILLDEGEVCLPSVGTLILVRHAAKRLSSKKLQRPYRELRFTGEERGVSLVDHLVRKADVAPERAEDIYTEYLSQSLRDGVLTIENLCTVANKKVQVEQQFENMANPNGCGVVKLNPRTNYFIYAVAGLCALFALGVAGYVVYSNGLFYADKGTTEQVVAKVAEQTPAPSAEPVEVIEAVAEPVAEVAAEPVTEVVIEQAEEAIAPATKPMTRGNSYAVWGVYSELKNAEEAVAWLGAKFPELEPSIYDYDGRYMVALYSLSSRSAVGRKVSALKAQSKSFKSVWVYTR